MWKRISEAIILGILIVSLTGCRKIIEYQIAEQMDLGQKYLLEENYEEAVLAFQKAIKLEPKRIEPYIRLAECYHGQSRYEEMKSILDEGVEAVGNDLEGIEEELKLVAVETYQELATYYSQQGQVEEELSCYTRILQISPESPEIREREEQVRQVVEKRSLLEEMIQFITEGDYSDIQSRYALGEEIKNLIEDLEEPIIMEDRDGMYLCVYPGGYIYYGEMKQGKREGNGYWYGGDKEGIRMMVGTWEDDMPEGNVVIEYYRNLEGNTEDRYNRYSRESGRVEKGVFEGNWEWDFVEADGSEHKMYVDYVNGQMQVADIHETGDIVASYCVTCVYPDEHYLHWNDNIDRVFGIQYETAQ